MSAHDWTTTLAGDWIIELDDGSIWKFSQCWGSIVELTTIHKRNPALTASTLKSAKREILAWIGAV